MKCKNCGFTFKKIRAIVSGRSCLGLFCTCSNPEPKP